MHKTPEFPYRTVGRHRGGRPSDSLGTSDELNLFSLAQDGLDCIAGVGRSHINLSRVNFPEHVHPGCLEMHYCLRGSMTFSAEGKEYRCMPGEVFLTQPKVPHHLVARRLGQRHYWLLFKFPDRRGGSVLGLAPKESALLCRRLAAIDRRLFAADERLKTLFQRLFDTCDLEPRGTFRTIRLKSLALSILLALLDSAERGGGAREPVNERMAEVIREIRQDPARAASIEELARRSALSESRFSYLFKQTTGLPPHSFIVSCRMEETRRRLCSTKDSIAKIAKDMGFSSARHLAVQFRQHCGMTPRECRQQTAKTLASTSPFGPKNYVSKPKNFSME